MIVWGGSLKFPREPAFERLKWREQGMKKRAVRLRHTLGLGEPHRLPMVLRGDGQCVEEDEQQNSPVAGIGLDSPAAVCTEAPIGSAEVATGQRRTHHHITEMA